MVGWRHDRERDDDEAADARRGAFRDPPLLPSLVRVSGTGSDAAMNSIDENQDSEFKGAKRLDRRQRVLDPLRAAQRLPGGEHSVLLSSSDVKRREEFRGIARDVCKPSRVAGQGLVGGFR